MCVFIQLASGQLEILSLCLKHSSIPSSTDLYYSIIKPSLTYFSII